MAMRSSLDRLPHLSRSSPRISRCFSDGKGKVLSEEERAAENIYIQKMERERAEKMKLKAEKVKAQTEKDTAEKTLGSCLSWRVTHLVNECAHLIDTNDQIGDHLLIRRKN